MFIALFSDGETWNTLDGVQIVEIPDDLELEEVEELLREDRERLIVQLADSPELVERIRQAVNGDDQ